MLEVKGFRGFRFAGAKVGALDHVITPPYDVITPEERRLLAQRSPYNMVHVTLPEARAGSTPYEAAASDLYAWIAQGALEQDANESFYILEQAFKDLHGVHQARRGFFGVAGLPGPGENAVLAHEQTFSHVVEDRQCLIEATHANLEPVFVLYADPEGRLAGFLEQARAHPPDVAARTIDGVMQRVWRVPPDDRVTAFFRDTRLYIADGHHRFRTACMYRDRMRKKERPSGRRPYDYILMGFVSLSDPGLRIYPNHRLMPQPPGFGFARFVPAIERWFEVVRVDAALPETIEATPGCAIGVATRDEGRFLLRLRDVDRTLLLGADRSPAWRELDVAVLHRGLIENIFGVPPETPFVYERDASRALAAVTAADNLMAFLLKATQADQIRACAEAGETMPHKSTYFFPKLPSGTVIYRHSSALTFATKC